MRFWGVGKRGGREAEVRFGLVCGLRRRWGGGKGGDEAFSSIEWGGATNGLSIILSNAFRWEGGISETEAGERTEKAHERTSERCEGSGSGAGVVSYREGVSNAKPFFKDKERHTTIITLCEEDRQAGNKQIARH
jgi:hypothetical protein